MTIEVPPGGGTAIFSRHDRFSHWRIGELQPRIGQALMPLTREFRLSPRLALGAATVGALVVGLVTGMQAYLARAGSADAIPLGLAVQNRTFAGLSWVLVGIGVVAVARRWPVGRDTWKQALPIHLAAAVAAGWSVNLLLHTVLWLLGAERIALVQLPDVILRDTLDHAHLNLLVYAVVAGVVWTMAAPAAAAQCRYASRLTARRRDTLTIVAVDDVDWIEGADDYACLHVGPRRHLTDDRLRALEQTLDPSRFVRVHRSALVNLSRVREVRDGRWGDAVAVLHNGTRVRVSRTRRDVLMAALGGKREPGNPRAL